MYACSPRWKADWITEEDLEIASRLDIPSLFVETNGYWSTDDGTTREKLMLLREKVLRKYLHAENGFRELRPDAFYLNLTA